METIELTPYHHEPAAMNRAVPACTGTTAPHTRLALLCGGTGFIGKYLHAALLAAGWQVRLARRRGQDAVDYRHATAAHAWRRQVAGVSLVINAVGVLRDTPATPMAMLHDAAPRALFDACAEAGVAQVIQLSALGIDGSDTAYARSKRAADQHLLALMRSGVLAGAVLRPSLVFGLEGASTRLFLHLARLPWLPLPDAVATAQVQPLAVWELATATARLAGHTAAHGILELGGPRALSLAGYIALLRQQLGKPPARCVRMPDALTRLSARIGDAFSASPWCSQSLDLLKASNTTDAATLASLLGRPATCPSQFLAGGHSHAQP